MAKDAMTEDSPCESEWANGDEKMSKVTMTEDVRSLT